MKEGEEGGCRVEELERRRREEEEEECLRGGLDTEGSFRRRSEGGGVSEKTKGGGEMKTC